MTQRADHPSILLASSSPYRRQQLETWGIPFTSVSPDIDETLLKKKLPSLGPEDLCRHLAKAKAESLVDKFPHSLIIGSDQVACFEGNILDKPGSPNRARQQLLRLSGNTHSLITGLHVIYQQKAYATSEEIQVTLKKLHEDEVEDYLQWDQPWDCAGAYKFEKRGICLVDRVQGRDPSSILGLPLIGLTEAIENLLGQKPFSLFLPTN